MPTLATKEQALARKHYYKLPNGTDTWVSSYIGVNSVERRELGMPPRTPPESFPPALEPIAFLVEQSSHSKLPGHYHQADQFQVFVAGTGFFGSKPITGLTIHYAMAFTPYAPIQSTEKSIEYFTLRNGWDPGAQWMPEKKAGLMDRKHPHRHGLGLIPALLGDADGPVDLTEVCAQNIVPFAADGLGATLYQTTSSALVEGPSPASGRGQYWLVLRGQCEINGEAASEKSLLFVSPEDAPPRILSNAEGVSILLMQFPKRDI